MDVARLSVDRLMPRRIQRLLFESKIDEDLAQMTIPTERCYISVDFGDALWLRHDVELCRADFYRKWLMRTLCVVAFRSSASGPTGSFPSHRKIADIGKEILFYLQSSFNKFVGVPKEADSVTYGMVLAKSR